MFICPTGLGTKYDCVGEGQKEFPDRKSTDIPEEHVSIFRQKQVASR
jgi:hypothetical protein